MREEFDLDETLVYLNAANQSILPRRISDAIARYGREYERNPSAGLNAAWGHLWESQRRLAQFVGASPSDLFLRPNVTSVLNTFLLGIPLPAGGEIIVGELEYGAIVNVCRMRAARDGLGLRVLRMPGTAVSLRRVSEAELVDLVISQLGPRTKMLLLSHVLGGTGLILPIREIARETRRRGIYLVVDGAYAPGAIAIDFAELADVDFYGCSLYKWMLGPKGTAFGWVAPGRQALLQPLSAGWTTYQSFAPFADFGGGSRFQETFQLAGCRDFAPYRAISDTMDFWARLGTDCIQRRMRDLQTHLRGAVERNLGWLPLTPEADSLRGPLAAFRLPGRWQDQGNQILTRLRERARVQVNTFCLRGQWSVVFSPHIHNREDEIDQAVARIHAELP